MAAAPSLRTTVTVTASPSTEPTMCDGRPTNSGAEARNENAVSGLPLLRSIEVAAVMGTDQGLVDQLHAAGDTTDEPLWPLPMVEKYKPEIRSEIADLKNLGGPNAGSITAALFLAEFVGDRPFAHVDIAGTAEFPTASTWRTAGCTGFGARLLVEAALDFTRPGS